MTNGEKYKTAKDRHKAFDRFCKLRGGYQDCDNCNLKEEDDFTGCILAWLDLESEKENPMNCPFCGGECELHEIWDNEECKGVGFNVRCKMCEYKSPWAVEWDGSDAIAAHNRVCKAVASYKEGKVK